MKLRIGTRGSALALAQAGDVAARLRQRAGVDAVELLPIQTAGDSDRTSPFARVGAAGIFVRAIERALAEGEVDLAVHSYKDLPSESPEGLVVAAVPEREDPRDRLLVRAEANAPERGLLPLQSGARVGTASARRAALIHSLRPDLEVEHLRGNVPTRVERLRAGDFDAILLAGAGIDRLTRAGQLALGGEIAAHDLDPERFVPAPSQGAIACQVRAGDEATREAVASLDDAAAHRPVRAERALLARVQAGCDVPFGAWCRADGDALTLFAFFEGDRGPRTARATGAEPDGLADEVFARLTEAAP